MQRPVSEPAASTPSAPHGAGLGISDDEYGSIEAAMLESARGRRFLHEFARRNRSAETRSLLEAVRRLERALSTSAEAEPGRPLAAHPESWLGPREASAIVPILAEAVDVLDCVARITARATQDIRTAAEQVQETAWRLRDIADDTSPSSLALQLETQVEDIDEVTSVETIATQRIAKVSHALRCLRNRLDPSSR